MAIGSLQEISNLEKENSNVIVVSDLNNALAGYMDMVRQMRAQAGAGLDPKAYKDAMRALEEEMMNLKNMYERELSRLRYVHFAFLQNDSCTGLWNIMQ